jgi:uncharacterized protein
VTAPVFLDMSGIYEVADRRAPRHAECQEHLGRLLAGSVPLITTEIVLAEAHALVLRRIGPGPALELIDRVTSSSLIEVVAHDSALRERAVALLRARPGRPYSLADAVSFLVMRDRGATHAFTLDRDFQAEGFTLVPELP